MVATVQSRLPSCTPEKARLILSQHRWSEKDTVKSLFPVEATKHHVQADSLPRTLDAEFECEKTTLATDTQTSPTTAQQVLAGLGAQTTKVVDRVYDPSPIPPDQPGTLARQTTTTDTTPGQWTRGVEDVKTEKTGEFLASGRALRLLSQTPNSTVAPLSSSEAATACGAGPPEGAETPLSALGPQFQDKRPHLPEALLRTEQSCFSQDLLRAACHFCDYCPTKALPEINDMFTFNYVGYILFDQTKWATYMEAMKEDKPPPDCSRHMQADLTYLLLVTWTKDGWMDTLEEEKVLDEDEYYAHLDNLDFG